MKDCNNRAAMVGGRLGEGAAVTVAGFTGLARSRLESGLVGRGSDCGTAPTGRKSALASNCTTPRSTALGVSAATPETCGTEQTSCSAHTRRTTSSEIKPSRSQLSSPSSKAG